MLEGFRNEKAGQCIVFKELMQKREEKKQNKTKKNQPTNHNL